MPDDPPVTTPDNQPETEVPTAVSSEPTASSSPPPSAESVAMTAEAAEAVPPTSGVQSLPEPPMTITVVGQGGRSKAFTWELNPELEGKLLSIPWERSKYHDVLDLLSTLAQIFNKTTPPKTGATTPASEEPVRKRVSIFADQTVRRPTMKQPSRRSKALG